MQVGGHIYSVWLTNKAVRKAAMMVTLSITNTAIPVYVDLTWFQTEVVRSDTQAVVTPMWHVIPTKLCVVGYHHVRQPVYLVLDRFPMSYVPVVPETYHPVWWLSFSNCSCPQVTARVGIYLTLLVQFVSSNLKPAWGYRCLSHTCHI